MGRAKANTTNDANNNATITTKKTFIAIRNNAWMQNDEIRSLMFRLQAAVTAAGNDRAYVRGIADRVANYKPTSWVEAEVENDLANMARANSRAMIAMDRVMSMIDLFREMHITNSDCTTIQRREMMSAFLDAINAHEILSEGGIINLVQDAGRE